MRITLTQEASAGVAIGATAVLRVDLSATGAPPMASAALLGVSGGAFAKVALGEGLALVDGVLGLDGGGSGYTLPAATAKVRGGVTVGANITLSGDAISLTSGNVTAALGYTPADAAGLAKVATSGAYADLSGTPAPYTLPAATGATLGGVVVGSNITVTAGTISLTGGNIAAALGYTPVDAAGAAAAAPVQSVAGRTGVVTLGTADISGFSTAAAAAAPVQSVAGRTGVVTLGTADISGFSAAAAAAAPVQSVAGRTGAVTLGTADISGFSTAAAAAAPVQSVAGRTGVVTLGTADISGFGAAAAAAAPVQSVGGATGAVALDYGVTVDFSQGAVPATGTITLDGALSAATTITDVVHKVGTAGGTIDFAVQIVSGGVATSITGLDALSSTASTYATGKATAANKAAAGDSLQLVISKVTGTPAGANINIRGTRP